MAIQTIPLREIIQTKEHDAWIDCTIGGVLCPCGGFVGMLDVFGDEQACQACGRRFRLVVTVEMDATDRPDAATAEGGGGGTMSEQADTYPRSPVIHVKEMARFPNAVYVGRPMPRQRLAGSVLANPFKIGEHGDRREVLASYAVRLSRRIEAGERDAIEAVIGCRGRPLACWCRRSDDTPTPNNRCHADIINDWLEPYSDDELRAKIAG